MTRFMKAMMAAVVVGAAANVAAAQQDPKPMPVPKPAPVPMPQPMPQPQPMPMPQQAPDWKLGVKISANNGGGLKIHEVFAGSPAEQAGLKAGMVLLTVDGALLNDPAAARDKIMLKTGDTLDLVYQDGAAFFQVTAKLTTTTVMLLNAGNGAQQKLLPKLKDVKRVEVRDPRKR